MTADALRQFLVDKGVGSGMAQVHIRVVDRLYDLPDDQDFQIAVSAALDEDFKILQVDDYQPERNDCDDFALLCTALVRLFHKRSTDRASGVAVGMVGYLSMKEFPWGGHQACFYVARVAGERILRFYEPQTRQVVALTQDEIASIEFVYV